MKNIKYKGEKGTLMYCPKCYSHQYCVAFPLTEIGQKEGQRQSSTEYNDLEWFHRARECSSCSGIFQTAEIDFDKLNDLINLRSQLTVIKCAVDDLDLAGSAIQQLDSVLIFLKDLQKLSLLWES